MATLPGPTPAPGIRPSWTWPLTRSVPSLLLSSWTMFFGPALEDGISSPDGASAAIDASARTATIGTRPYVRFLTILCRNPRGRVESEVVTNWETREQDTSPRRCPARYAALLRGGGAPAHESGGLIPLRRWGRAGGVLGRFLRRGLGLLVRRVLVGVAAARVSAAEVGGAVVFGSLLGRALPRFVCGGLV